MYGNFGPVYLLSVRGFTAEPRFEDAGELTGFLSHGSPVRVVTATVTEVAGDLVDLVVSPGRSRYSGSA